MQSVGSSGDKYLCLGVSVCARLCKSASCRCETRREAEMCAGAFPPERRAAMAQSSTSSSHTRSANVTRPARAPQQIQREERERKKRRNACSERCLCAHLHTLLPLACSLFRSHAPHPHCRYKCVGDTVAFVSCAPSRRYTDDEEPTNMGRPSPAVAEVGLLKPSPRC